LDPAATAGLGRAKKGGVLVGQQRADRRDQIVDLEGLNRVRVPLSSEPAS